MTKITILGAGMMGSAFTFPLADNGHEINLVGTHLDEEIIEQLDAGQIHPGLGVTLPDGVRPLTYDRLGQALDGADLLVVAVNSLGIDWVGMVLTMLDDELRPEMPLLFLTKGMEGKNDGNYWVSKNERLRILPDTLRDSLMPPLSDQISIMALGGPSNARELAARRHTSVLLAGSDQSMLTRYAELLRTSYHHVWTSTDLIGMEVCVALKNVFAVAVGLAQGLLESESAGEQGATLTTPGTINNPAAAIFAQGLHEISYLVDYMGGDQKTILSLAGVGDLYSTSQGGPNVQLGRLLGLGMRYTDAKQQHMPNVTIEGAELALAIGRTIEYLLLEGELDGTRLPLLRMMVDIICNDGVVDIPWEKFFG